MAHLENFKRGSLSHMFDHYAREEGDGVNRSNENIDEKRTHLNFEYFFKKDGVEDREGLVDAIHSRVRDAVKKTNRTRAAGGRKPLYKSAAVMSCWVITLPSDCPEEHMKQFFKETIEFLRKRYGKNALGRFVHLDETTAHMHAPITLVNEDGLIDKQAVINRADMRTFHQDLQAYLDEHLGFHVSVLLDEDDLVGKAKSKLTRDELTALNADIRASVDAETAVERKKLEERELTLQHRQKACESKEKSLREVEKRADKGMKDLIKLQDLIRATWAAMKAQMRDFANQTFAEVEEEWEREQRKEAFLAEFQDEVEQDECYKSSDSSTYSPEF